MNKTHQKGKKKSKSLAASAQRNFAKAVVRAGAAESVSPPPAPGEIEPLDYTRCQADISTNVNLTNFMMMGGQIGGVVRCSRVPTMVVTEKKSGKDGTIGHMTLCDECFMMIQVCRTDVLFRRIEARFIPKHVEVLEAHCESCGCQMAVAEHPDNDIPATFCPTCGGGCDVVWYEAPSE